MNVKLWLRSPENKPRWMLLFLVGIVAALTIAATAAYFKNAIAQNTTPTLSVDARSDRHPISPDIYGMNDYESHNRLCK